jgi:hypothetical protein
MHALPEDLRTTLALGADEPVRHAAFSSYPSSRGSIQTALVVSSRRIFVGEQPPDAEWTVRAHDRTAITGLEIDAQGIGEATVGLVAGEQITDQLKVARLDRMDFADAAPFVAAEAEDGGGLAELEPLPASDFDLPPTVEAVALVPVGLASGEELPEAEAPIELIPIADLAEVDADADDTGADAGTDPGDRFPFQRTGPPEGTKLGSRFRFRPNPTTPGGSVIVHWHLNWPEDRKVRGVHWELQAREHTSITVRRTTSNGRGGTTSSSTTYRESRQLMRGGGTLFGKPPKGFLSNMASGMLAMAGVGEFPVLEAGVYEWQEVLRLHDELPPTYHGTNADVEYDVRAWVDRPAAFDHRAGGELRVLPPQPGVIPTNAFWPAGGGGLVDSMRPEIELELRCTSGAAEPGGDLLGEVICINRSGKTVRGITVTLQQFEYARARGYTRSTTRGVATLTLPAPAPDDATPQRFAFAWPKGGAFYAGRYSSVEYRIAASVDVAWGLDVHATVGVKFDT